MPLLDGALIRLAFDAAKRYIANNPELTDKIFDMLHAWLFPSPTPVFGAGEEIPEPLQAFGAELEELGKAA